MNFPDRVRYTSEHVWVKQEDNRFTIGITDFAQDHLGKIVYVDLPETGVSFEAGEIFGTVESMITISALFMPFEGDVVDVNGNLFNEPEMVNKDPYGKGWIIHIKTDFYDAFECLLTSHEYIHSLSHHSAK
ncbi:MAG: glycine cleavage system protein GcvH [Deltaproteobacteria bacterium]|nr:glycine cleavage system protein GcvH [Deltaproteobacteria bacterium]MBT4262861.1 glycine cleavage system protein GcvH [Deltaproteobacteria bacterium]MBT4640924.1 glycine cleavage system protein GcvH [Deltaproteobacteria bacterium]MBT6500446.1 glycine cleavage system protein GcvH [Deltaproteobacteria bacterium]MBT6612538.1 glycine cleavage system protein GcvH [Deltaproteobacteria bacterium]